MRVLIVGGTGVIGQALLGLCRSEPDFDHIDVVSRTGSLHNENSEKVRFIDCDRNTEDFRDILYTEHYDVVVDLIAYSESDVRVAYDCLSHKNTHYIFVSTFQVYRHCPQRTLCTEDSVELGHIDRQLKRLENNLLTKLDVYIEGKLKCEKLLLGKDKSGDLFPYTIVRPSQIYSREDKKSHLNWYINRIKSGIPIIVTEQLLKQGYILRPIFVQDLAEAIKLSMNNKAMFKQIINVAQDELLTPMSFLEEIYRSLDRTPNILTVNENIYEEYKFSEKYHLPLPSGILLDTRKINDLLNFSSAKTREWLKEIYMELSVNVDSPKVQISDEETMFCTKLKAIQSNVAKKAETFDVILGGAQNEQKH